MEQSRGSTRIVVQSGGTLPGTIYSALLESARPGLTRIRVAVAYTTLAGCQVVFGQFSDLLLSRWRGVTKEFITSFDYGLTEPSALDYLQSLNNSEVRIASTGAIQRPSLRPERAFHAKAYMFDFIGPTGSRTEVVLGSANLTQRGLTVNDELATRTVFDADDDGVELAWSTLRDGSEPLTPTLLEQYRSASQLLGRTRDANDNVERPPVVPGSYLAMGDAIAHNKVDPGAMFNFWIEAGSMSSGGSNNQLELPRGANQYFGLDFQAYADNHETMGEVDLEVRGKILQRQLRWHGNNRMERIYLPTIQQGGYNYAGTIILFTYVDSRFRVVVVPEGSPVANGWLQASLNGGHVFRVGGNSDRMCGLF